jgi:hypothetical protein
MFTDVSRERVASIFRVGAQTEHGIKLYDVERERPLQPTIQKGEMWENITHLNVSWVATVFPVLCRLFLHTWPMLGMKMEAALLIETLVNIYWTTWCHFAEYSELHILFSDNNI